MSQENSNSAVANAPKSFKITLVEATELVQNYVTRFDLGSADPKVPNILGGTINKNSIKGVPPTEKAEESGRLYTGSMAWFCLNNYGVEGFPEFFLAFEENDQYEKEQDIRYPDSPVLMCPTVAAVFEYEGQAIASLLKNHQRTPPRLVDMPIIRSSVRQFCGNFSSKKLFSDENKFPYGFFENNEINDIDELLLKPEVKYLRYYFGRDPIKTTNKIRVIIIGVDEKGRNLAPQNEHALTDDDYFIIQKSWPPSN